MRRCRSPRCQLFGAVRRAGDQPSHLSDRALFLIAPHSKHSIADDGGAAAVTRSDQRRFAGSTSEGRARFLSVSSLPKWRGGVGKGWLPDWDVQSIPAAQPEWLRPLGQWSQRIPAHIGSALQRSDCSCDPANHVCVAFLAILDAEEPTGYLLHKR